VLTSVRPFVTTVVTGALLAAAGLALAAPAQARIKYGYCLPTAPAVFVGATRYGTGFTEGGTLYRELTEIRAMNHGERFDVVVNCLYEGDLWQTVPGSAPVRSGTYRWYDPQRVVYP
jgi:hypothetical protein